MLIDSKGKIFGLINIIDLAVVLIVIVLGAGYLYRDKGSETTAAGKHVEMKVVCNYAYPGSEKSLKVGDRLVSNGALTNTVIKDFHVENAWDTAADAKGQSVLSRNPFRKDIYVTLEAPDAQVAPAEITVAGQKVRAGKEDFTFKTQTVELKAIVMSVVVK